MKNANVSISADELGNVIRQSNTNSEYGFIRLVQERATFGNTGWLKKSNLSTILHGKLEDLQSLGLNATDTLPGKIVIKESLVPFNKNDADRDLKMAGDTGIICSVDGQPIYRKTIFVGDPSAKDVLVSHDNGQDISLANGNVQAKVNTTVTPAEAFGIGDVEDAVEIEEEVEESFEL
jgi:hypothetical protein